MSEYPDEYADACEHVNVREEAGGMLKCDDCGETRQGALWRHEIADVEPADDGREVLFSCCASWSWCSYS